MISSSHSIRLYSFFLSNSSVTSISVALSWSLFFFCTSVAALSLWLSVLPTLFYLTDVWCSILAALSFSLPFYFLCLSFFLPCLSFFLPPRFFFTSWLSVSFSLHVTLRESPFSTSLLLPLCGWLSHLLSHCPVPAFVSPSPSLLWPALPSPSIHLFCSSRNVAILVYYNFSTTYLLYYIA